jgi:hypothetical protein
MVLDYMSLYPGGTALYATNLVTPRFALDMARNSAPRYAGDLDGDGLDDLIDERYCLLWDDGPPPCQDGHVEIFRGSRAGLSYPATQTLVGDAQDYGSVAEGIGDTNGDGFGDVAIFDPETGEIAVHLGSASGISTSPAVRIATGVPEAMPEEFAPVGIAAVQPPLARHR